MSLPTTPADEPVQDRRPVEGGSTADAVERTADDRPHRFRVIARRVTTTLACLLVYLALIAPNQLEQVTPAALVRVPLEAVVGLVVLLLVPARARTAIALVGGAGLGVLTVLRMLDMGFDTFLSRSFDPVFDWTTLGKGVTFLRDSIGQLGALAVAAGAVVLAVVLVGLMAVSTLRATRLVSAHRSAATRALPAVAVVWVACFALGAQIVAPVPVAALSTASIAVRTSAEIPAVVQNHQAFIAQAETGDAFADVPGADLLTKLRGKDVMLTFVESYGRSAIEDPTMASVVDPVLDDGTRRLQAAGFAARSGFLTSPVHGGGSWMAHATLLSGLWVTNQHDYETLIGTDRFTLTRAFQRADWRTLGIMPGVTTAWPEGSFYGIDQVYDTHHLGYRGTEFTDFHTPDQFTLSAFQRLEHGKPGHPPLMTVMPTVTSHWPWAPLPHTVDWNAVGDGSVYDTMADGADPVEAVWSDPARVKAAYTQSISYTLSNLISWLQTYGDDNTVLVMLGDHQPAPVVSGTIGGDQVPITIVAKDPAVLDAISDWHWDDGLKPSPQAPVLRMDAFRDKFLTAFGPDAQSKH